ncbi:hypothetical protein JQS43_05505 [Natronosporangium hydrolyticum]|uniref:Uncharacterized protein n=1 Tax=Natronosporangium hydrolyticum TaxID=2811111 RepID=A0A895YDB4_9ACTN|nr:hypothetical protein [Natronosporangium hydrolyticum]QSB15794.1 hypothetical protein JQS43_05505 [Natronosporangium hydrolyticum]
MTPPASPGDQRRHRLEAELVEALAGLPVMQQPDSRQQLVRMLRRRLGPDIPVYDIAEPRYQCVEIVEVCLASPDSWQVVIEVVASFHPHAPQLAQVVELQQEWVKLHDQLLREHEEEVRDVLSEEDWAQLRALLTAIRPSQLGRLFQRATGHRAASPPIWCVDAWDIFVYLAGQYTPPESLPPEMVFLLLLEQEVDEEAAARIRRRNQRQASKFGLTAQLDQRRALTDRRADLPADPQLYVLIQVEQEWEPELGENAEPAVFTVSHYRQWLGDESWHSPLRGVFPDVSRARLALVVEEIVAQVELEWADRRAEVAIEVVLPWQLLNEDIAWWPAERPAAYLGARVLAMTYPVVVRSLDRLRQRRWHGAWRRRWEQLRREPAGDRVYRSRPHGADYFTTMEAELTGDARWGTLVLSEPPAPGAATGIQEVLTGLRAGLPAIIWHRSEPTTDRLWDELRELVGDGGTLRLPIHVRQLRLDALRAEPDQRDQHIGRHVVLLWDDPERRPELDGPEDRIGGANR